MLKIITISVGLVLVGCMSEPKPTFIAPTPLCMTDEECAVMWAAARAFVEKNIQYKIQTDSPNLVETLPADFKAWGDTFVSATVRKEPLTSGGYAIQAEFHCPNPLGCHPNQWAVLDAFNRVVARAGQISARTLPTPPTGPPD